MSKSKLYETVISNGYDVGSGALAVADENIKVVLNEYGEYVSVPANGDISAFDNPKLALVSAMSDESPDEDEISQKLYSKIPGIKHDNTIGYYIGLYAGHVIEGDYRKNASSGGFGTWIVKELIERKLIDGVIHVKEANDGDGILFKYGISRTLDEIKAGAKSKYYPAEFSDAIKQIKKTKGKYAFVGIPSIVMELRLLALQDKEVADRVAFTIGLICGHQKSTKYAECLAWECGIEPGQLEKIDFRKKAEGKPSIDYDTELIGKVDGKRKTIRRSTKGLFPSTWGHGMFKVKFSDYTDDALNETADIALGDAWLPNYTADWKGTNIAIIRNPVIAQIFHDSTQDGKVHLDEITEYDIIKSQSGLVHHAQEEMPYRLSLASSKKYWTPNKRYSKSKISLLKKYVQRTRLAIRTKSRTAYKSAVNNNDWAQFVLQMSPLLKQYKSAYILLRLKTVTPKKIWGKIFVRLKTDH